MTRATSDRLLAIARRAIAACEPRPLARQAALGLSVSDASRIVLLGAGKAASAMACGVADALGPAPLRGLIVAKALPTAAPLARVEQLAAGHPEPDERSVAAGTRMLTELESLDPSEHAIVALSGGASALLAVPLAGLSLPDLAAATRALLAGGVPIAEINMVRKHLSATAGGRLARATRAAIDVLVLSDVLGDDLSAIGSGPFAPDSSTFADALDVAQRAGGVPAVVLRALEAGVRGDRDETPKPGDPCFARIRHQLLASNVTLLDAAVDAAAEHGYRRVTRLAPTGHDVDAVAKRLDELARNMGPNELVILGGEPTVRLPAAPGRGGRNQQLALRMAQLLHELTGSGLPDVAAVVESEHPQAGPNEPRVRFLAVASDGEDGNSDAAGAVVSSSSWGAMLAARLDPLDALSRANAHAPLAAAGALLRTGPTGTNVLDLHLLETVPS